MILYVPTWFLWIVVGYMGWRFLTKMFLFIWGMITARRRKAEAERQGRELKDAVDKIILRQNVRRGFGNF